MAIFSFNCRLVCRSKGKSSVGRSAYITRRKFKDKNTNKSYDYTKKLHEVAYTTIMAPNNSPTWVYDSEILWNKVEEFEKRKDAQTAREIIIALPLELNLEERKKLIDKYVKDIFVVDGMIAEISIHNLEKNPHVHILLTTRKLFNNDFSIKEREWNKPEKLKEWRTAWANMCNSSLIENGLNIQISEKSNHARKIKKIPTLHIGNNRSRKLNEDINKRIKRINLLLDSNKNNFFIPHDTESNIELENEEIKNLINKEGKESNKRLKSIKDSIGKHFRVIDNSDSVDNTPQNLEKK